MQLNFNFFKHEIRKSLLFPNLEFKYIKLAFAQFNNHTVCEIIGITVEVLNIKSQEIGLSR